MTVSCPAPTPDQAPFSGSCFIGSPAWWQSGHAADCKSAYAGSIPTQASILIQTISPPTAGFLLSARWVLVVR